MNRRLSQFPTEIPHICNEPLLESICFFCFFNVMCFKEQEEEMSCWEGAEGGASKTQRHLSETELAHNFLSDDTKLDELPGPKFRSLRHLRQVNLSTFVVC